MTLIEWEATHNVGSTPAYRNKRCMLDNGQIPLHSRSELWTLTDYRVSSVSKGKIWFTKRNNNERTTHVNL